MSFRQYLTPNPHISCRPGWCLEYVRRTFDLPVKYSRAIDAWNASHYQHRNYDFPAGVAVPLWFEVRGVPAGHVVLRMPDGSIYSTSDDATVPHHHANLADLMAYYARGGAQARTLTYLGWTQDIAGYIVASYVAPPKPAPPVLRPASAPTRINPPRLIRVDPGDNLTAIARQFGTTVPHLLAMNKLANPNVIYPGQLLRY